MNGASSLLNLAPKANEEIHAVAQKVVDSVPGARLAKGPIKSAGRITEKVMSDYGGDFSKMKDTVRNTIVVKDKADIQKVLDLLPKSGEFPVKAQLAASDPFGYSGFITNHRLSNGLVGEIQVNTPEMIFGKVSEKEAREQIGDEAYDAIAKRTGLEGGLGHVFYEKARTLDPSSEEFKKITEMSRKYNDALRGD